MKRPLTRPFFVVNPKAYLYGKQALELAKVADEAAERAGIDVLFTVQHVDAAMIRQATKHLFVTVQHLDGIEVGRGMGYILPEALAEAGVDAVFLNHAEHQMELGALVKAIHRAKEVGILTIVCADSLEEAQAVAMLGPDIMVCEPTALIGTGEASGDEYKLATNQAVRAIDPTIYMLQAAGISTVDDVEATFRTGADGTGGTSGIVCAEDPAAIMREMIAKVAEFKGKQGANEMCEETADANL